MVCLDFKIQCHVYASVIYNLQQALALCFRASLVFDLTSTFFRTRLRHHCRRLWGSFRASTVAASATSGVGSWRRRATLPSAASTIRPAPTTTTTSTWRSTATGATTSSFWPKCGGWQMRYELIAFPFLGIHLCILSPNCLPGLGYNKQTLP